MGRGLSELQRWILQSVEYQGAISYADICVGYFGWLKPDKAHGGEPLDPGRVWFSATDIGFKRYRSVHVSITRSCRRLAQRGLVDMEMGEGWVARKPNG